MADRPAIDEIIATYEKYGWVLRRIMLTAETARAFGPTGVSTLGEVRSVDSSIDAALFSRPPKNGPVAWEIRYLGDDPYALLESLDEADSGFEEAINALETRLAKAVLSKKSA